jgi:hypothetical protein
MVADELVFFVEELLVHLGKDDFVELGVVAVGDGRHHVGPGLRQLVGWLLMHWRPSRRQEVHAAILEMAVLEVGVVLEVVLLEVVLVGVAVVE